MPFTSPLIVQRISPRDWMLVAPLRYQGRVDHYVVPEASVTDFASVPRFLQGFVQATGTWTCAAVVHDVFCTDLVEARRQNRSPMISARDADGVFRRIMREEGVGVVKRWAMWSAVRLAALKNPARRAGWFRDLPLVLLITLLELAVVVAVLLGLHFLIDLAL
jgi:hypothetical protein